MSRYKCFAYLMIIVEFMLLLLCNGLYFYQNSGSSGRLYRVEAGRVARELQEKTPDEIDLTKYNTILSVGEFDSAEICNNDYVIQEVAGTLYRIEYRVNQNHNILIYMDVAMIIMIGCTVIILIYVQKKILQPFQNMSHLSYELAKGNLSVPIKEEKGKLFGRFLWGMDMLREKLESDKEKELEFQKDRKTLILSLSHDIKTPLSAIELYSKALSSGLYETKEKQEEAVEGIARNVGEIKRYVDEIVTASREDFLNLEVVSGEFYLSEIIKSITSYYRDKLSVIHTKLEVEEFEECLLKGDRERLIETLQNIMENAIKYGDGKDIAVSWEDEEDCKLIQIENTGSTLKEEELQNIFDSFYRGSNSQNIKGNGLGLYICKNLMRKMDGDVFARITNGNFCVTVVVRKA